MAGSANILPVAAASSSDAYLAKTGRLVHGYFTSRGGALSFHVQIEDTARHKLSNPVIYTGDVLTAMNAVARHLDPHARDFSTASEQAVAAWGRHDFEYAVALDPDFGGAWFAWAETLAQKGDNSGALDVASRALSRASLRSPVDRARLELLSATVRNDSNARVKALTDLSRLATTDLGVLENLAQVQLNTRHFPEAAALFRNILRIDPQNAPAMNLLGYAEAYTGNVDAARKTLEDYGRLEGQKTNSLDSLGEVFFVNGRFADAEKYFEQAHASAPEFLAGTDLLKAAYARWLNGDLKGADGIAARYFDFRRMARDPLLAWREAVWLYSTGRRDQAIAKLRTVTGTGLVERQLAVWNGQYPSDLDALKARFEHTPPANDGAVRALYAAALLKAGRKDEARQLVTMWPLPAQQGVDPVLESVIFPIFLEVRRSVGF